MRETIIKTYIPDLDEPGFGRRFVFCKDLSCSPIQWITMELTDHDEESKLFQMEDCLAREAATHEVNEWARCSWVKFK